MLPAIPEGFSPRNGEVILKEVISSLLEKLLSFSPRNGEVILKLLLHIM